CTPRSLRLVERHLRHYLRVPEILNSSKPLFRSLFFLIVRIGDSGSWFKALGKTRCGLGDAMSQFIRVSSKSRLQNCLADNSSNSKINIKTAMLRGADPEACEVGSRLLERCGLTTMKLSTVADLRKGMAEQEACLLLCEDVLPDGHFRDVLKVVRDSRATVTVILFS